MNGFHRLRMVSHRCQSSDHPCLPGDGVSLLRMLGDLQPDKHPPGSAWSGSDASCRVGLAIRC